MLGSRKAEQWIGWHCDAPASYASIPVVETVESGSRASPSEAKPTTAVFELGTEAIRSDCSGKFEWCLVPLSFCSIPC